MFIEILSFFLRPVSHSVRLFANMLAGHIALKVFAGFVAMLGFSLGALGWVGGVLPLALTVALYALEILVAFLQAYVFAILTCHLSQRRHSSGTLSGPGNFHPQPNLSSKESKMDPAAAKLIGAGIACIGMGGAGVGVGVIFGNYLAAAVRNPSAAQGQFGNLIFGFAVTEALGIFSLLIALLLLFVPL